MVSVIVPVYKVEPYLRQCLESIVNQTYRDLEIILVDDDSPDGCGSICNEYAQKDKRVKVFYIKHLGLSDARNYGVSKAVGKFVSFVDGDDWIEPDMFEILISVANENKADIVNSTFFHEYLGQAVIEPTINTKFVNVTDSVKELIHGRINAGIWGKLYRKECFDNHKFPSGHVFEDTSMLYKLFLNSATVVSIDKPFYHYRQGRNDSITETHTMSNLIDYWLAHKSRYDYLVQDARFNTDENTMYKLEQNCAVAIARTWRWCYANTAQEREECAFHFVEMQGFSAIHYPIFGIKRWPLFLRFSIFMARFNNTFVFALLYYMNQLYRRVKGKKANWR